MSASSKSAGDLMARIAEHTARVSQHLHEQGLPPLSFETAAQNAILDLPPAIDASRIAVLDAAREMTELYTGPRDGVISIAYGQAIKPALLRFISHYGIHQLVPASGSVSVAEIAKRTAIDPRVLRRLMRANVSLRLFREDTPGEITHSAMSLYMRDHPRASDYTWALAEHVYPAIYNIVDSLVISPADVEPALSAWMVGKQPRESSWFEYLNSDPVRARRFANVMAESHTVPGYDLSHMIDSYAWAAIREGGVIVDMGGSDGRFGRALLDAVPHVRVIVQDLPHIIQHAEQQQQQSARSDRPMDRSASDARLQLMPHDFFQEQPIADADAYVFRAVLHDWSDVQMASILRQLVPALRVGAKVLILDEILPPVGTLGLTAERNQHAMDLAMMAMCAAGSRELDEWQEAVHSADPGFIVTQVIQPLGSALGIIELTWQP